MSPMRATYILSACVCIMRYLPPSFAHYQHGMLLPTYITHSEPYQVASSSPVKMKDKPILSHDKSPLPDWWKTPDSKKFPIKAFLFRALCLISVARPSVDHYWQSFTDDDEWEKQQRKIINRLCNTNIVAGLVVLSAV
ncbi:hypothetical protein EV424DRAFT_550044 [Suillus variegatus]|nr:hypothetical protein EV424DRAFT_550044 [Suillus variegatus]